MKPLSNRQKSVLCQVARRAFDRLVARGEIVGIEFDTWRRDECERAVGKPGLREKWESGQRDDFWPYGRSMREVFAAGG